MYLGFYITNCQLSNQIRSRSI